VLLGAAGGALILLPLGQVLRYQGAELQDLAAERAALDPYARALSVQRGVLAHRDVADRVLRGRSPLEQERRLRQAELDESLRRLQDTLSAGWWMRALQESQSLMSDWHRLARRVVLRQIAAGDSLNAHQLLQEQAVQVMDLIQASAPATSTGALVALALPAVENQQQQQQQLAALEAALQLQDARLLAREAALREHRAALGVAFCAAAAALLALGWAALRRAGRPTGPGGGAGAEVGAALDRQERQGHGRRTTDAVPQRDETGPLLDRLRSGEAPQASEPR
jgi:hypothetical protein